MSLLKSIAVMCFTVLLALSLPAIAEVVYTPVNVSVPVGGTYPLDLNHDGVVDFVLRSQILQTYCQLGVGDTWNLLLTSVAGNAVVVTSGYSAAALLSGVPVDSSENYYTGAASLTSLSWGFCGAGITGQWFNVPNRYVGLEFRTRGANEVHYGWAKLSAVAYVDRDGRLHARVMLQGFAYETVPGLAITTGSQ